MPSDKAHNVLALDVGQRRTGLAFGDTAVKLPVPLPAVETQQLTPAYLRGRIAELNISAVVVGLPRNQSGQETAQTAWVRQFVDLLGEIDVPLFFQDESLTSVLAEEQLKASKKPYSKGDIDSMAASLILRDYLEARHA